MKNTVLKNIIEQFPDHSIRIKMLYRIDESFRDICEDYVLCLDSLNKTKAMHMENFWVQQELMEIRNELEKELILKIEE